MSIDTLPQWNPKYALPIYTRITHPRRNDYRVGEVYQMRIEDPERARELGQKPPFVYLHEAMLVSMQTMNIDQVPDIILAFDQNTSSKSNALDSIITDDGEIVMLIFLRLDKAKGLVTDGLEAVHQNMSRKAVEDDNMEGTQ